jgi:hypothetical protein
MAEEHRELTSEDINHKSSRDARTRFAFRQDNIRERVPQRSCVSTGFKTELPAPSDPDPAGAAIVQELLGGKFDEMSTWLNYTFQSFNFRARQVARPVL